MLGVDGSFIADRLPEGNYHVQFDTKSALALLAPMVTIRAGAVASGNFVADWRRVVLEVVDAQGAPVTGKLEIRCGQRETTLPCRGTLVLDPAPTLPIELRRSSNSPWTAPLLPDRDRIRVELR